MNEKSIIPGILVLLVAVGAVLFVMSGNETPTPSASPSVTIDTSASTTVLATSDNKVVQLAQCIKDSGAIFYGAFWCSHCRQQKDLFGKEAMAALAYVECSTPDGEGQTPICKDKKIESYPTWEFKDGTRTTGVQTLVQLAEKTSCVDPSGALPVVAPSSASLPE
jgi:thiol-disulfide isomerase/thioredoxin